MDPPPSAELGQHDRGLRPGELLADTHSGSGTERQEGAAWLAGHLRIEAVGLPVLTAQPALRPELLRL